MDTGMICYRGSQRTLVDCVPLKQNQIVTTQMWHHKLSLTLTHSQPRGTLRKDRQECPIFKVPQSAK